MILSSIETHAKAAGDNSALRFENKSFSYSALVHEVERVAQLLVDAGVTRSTPVGVFCENSSAILVIYYAMAKIGGTFVPLNSVLSTTEARYILEHAGISFLFCDQKLHESALNAAEGLSCKVLDADDFIAGPSSSALQSPSQVNDDFLIVYTSGSTGVPKAVSYSQAAEHAGNQALIELWDVGSKDKVLVGLPLGFLYGLSTAASMAMQAGSEVIVLRRFRPSDALDAIMKHGVTVFQGVPTMFSMMLEYAEQNDLYFDLSSVRLFISAGAPLSRDLRQRFFKRFNKTIEDYYALTEVRPVFGKYARSDEAVPSEAIGKAAPGVEVRIVDDSGQTVGPLQIGEVWVKAPATTSGYYKAPELTRAAFVDGFFRTGDLGYFDESGFYYLTGRIKDIIIRGGANIAPAEVEDVLASHDSVQLAAVIGVPDAKFGELPVAYLSLAGKTKPDDEELTAFCRKSLADFKVPVAFRWLDEMPLGITGKVDKKALLSLWKGEKQ
ncbi:class I adenylate-forming enzyme family protein [Pseudomonas sp. NY15181]|uniref:class I adenylate-forming enzyme family protein n=1 Tax=Pseudomonas sp. NY15181 TaxID=3400349 RepID=UPI003A84F1E4